MINIVSDVSTLTTIPEKTIDKFNKKIIYCICEGVQESRIANIPISEFDIGIGQLYIKHDVDGEIKYHFKPNDLLKKSIEQTVINNQNLLEITLNDALSKKFMEVYKDLC